MKAKVMMKCKTLADLANDVKTGVINSEDIEIQMFPEIVKIYVDICFDDDLNITSTPVVTIDPVSFVCSFIDIVFPEAVIV